MKEKLFEELVQAFARYQWNLEHPMTYKTQEELIHLYFHDSVFNAKVQSLASGVLQIAEKYLKE